MAAVLVWSGWVVFKTFIGGEGGLTSEPETEPEQSSEAEPYEPEPEPQEPDEDETVSVSAGEQWQLILLSADSPLPDNFKMPELETISGEYKVDARAAPFLRRMFNDAKLEGITLMLTSAYRSPEYQDTLFRNQIERQRQRYATEEEAIAAAAMIVLPPGTSEHHTGLAVDIVTPDYQVLDDGFANTPAAKWLAENSWKYGYILRYPKDKQSITNIIYEPWHFRFVGEIHAQAIKESGSCLEEYLIKIAFKDMPSAEMVSADGDLGMSSEEGTP